MHEDRVRSYTYEKRNITEPDMEQLNLSILFKGSARTSPSVSEMLLLLLIKPQSP